MTIEQEVLNQYKNKKVAIIGGTGFVGRMIVKKLSTVTDQIFTFSRRWDYNIEDGSATCYNGDVSNYADVYYFLNLVKPDIVFHAAAYKSVAHAEFNPNIAFNINTLGTVNILNAIRNLNISPFFIFISTDKACSPINLYGASKLMAEQLVLKYYRQGGGVVVRYGNVMGSTGSVFPVLLQRFKDDKNEIHLHSEEMTRFFFAPSDAVNFVLSAINGGKESSEVLIPLMKSIRMEEAFKIFSNMLFWKTEIILTAPVAGEKLHERMLNHGELQNAKVFPFASYYGPSFSKSYSISLHGDLSEESVKVDPVFDLLHSKTAYKYTDMEFEIIVRDWMNDSYKTTGQAI